VVEEITVTDVRFPTPAGEVTGYLAEPETAGPSPGVVVLHEAFGLNDDIRGWADRFAAEGYVALAPDLFSWGPTVRCIVSAFRTLRAGQGRAIDDIEAARAYLAAREDCRGQIGVIGFCMGGGFALLMAPRGFSAASDNYGEVPKDAEDVLKGACPIIASYGGKDRLMRGRPERLERALERAGVEHDVKTYPDANHSFLNRHTGRQGTIARVAGIGHHEPSADDAWKRILAFFDRHVAAT
jgi:carboxymethylenebutenolidase